jgi:hypothetical protein
MDGWLGMPVTMAGATPQWLVLNRFRSAWCNGDHGPSSAFLVVIAMQRYVPKVVFPAPAQTNRYFSSSS